MTVCTRRNSPWILLGVFALLTVPRVAAADGDRETVAREVSPGSPYKVLFVGNSYTKFNNLPRMVEKLADGIADGPRIQTRRVAFPGMTLRHHWNRDVARHEIQERRFTHVVIQGHSLDAIDRPAQLVKYGKRFQHEIARRGAQTVFYATWARKPGHRVYRTREDIESPEVMTQTVERVYRDIATQSPAVVAPVGRAWQIARERLPDLELYRADGTHPSEAGTYLAACVFYASLTGRPAEESEWRPYPMDELTALALQRAASEAVGITSNGAMAAASR